MHSLLSEVKPTQQRWEFNRNEPGVDLNAVVEVGQTDLPTWPTPRSGPYGGYGELELFVRDCELAFGEFPRHIRRRVLEFRDYGNIEGILFIRGLRTDDDVPDTPVDTKCDALRATYFGELQMGAIATALGQPVGYLQEKDGRVFQSLFPLPGQSTMQTNSSSAAFLKFHTEVAFHHFLPDYVLLYGLRQDREQKAKTIVSSVRRILPSLTLSQRRELTKPQFGTRVDASFGGGEGPTGAILTGDPHDPFLRFDDDFMTAETAAGTRALDALRSAVNREKREVAIAPGDLLVIDNRRAVHARSEYQAHYDGRDRWLLRLNVVRNLAMSVEERVPGTRVIATDCFTVL